MSKSLGFKVFLFILFVCKFFHFNAPFFEDLYKKHFVLVEIPAQILSTRPRVDNIGYLPEEVLSLHNLFRIIKTIDALTVQNISNNRPFFFNYGFNLELLFVLNQAEHRQHYIFGSNKADEYKQELEQNPKKAISTNIFLYPDGKSKPYLSRDEIREANIYQIQAFFYSLALLGVVALIVFFQTPHLLALKILAFVFLFFIFSTYESKVFIYFFGSCFIYVYYRAILILHRHFYLSPT